MSERIGKRVGGPRRLTLYVSNGICQVHNAGLPEIPCWDENEAARRLMAFGELLEACKRALQFIANGVELGYIRMPDTPDPARETPSIIAAAISKAEG